MTGSPRSFWLTPPSVKADLDDEYKDGKDKVKIDWVDKDQNKKDKTNIDEKVWAYTVGEDKIYTLKAVDSKTMTNAEINNGKAYISDGKNDFIVDKKTVFVDVEGETAYTGYNEVPDVDNATLAYVLSTRTAMWLRSSSSWTAMFMTAPAPTSCSARPAASP